jgi:hypothetical protein
MRRRTLIAGLSAWSLLAGLPASAAQNDRAFTNRGIALTVPTGWWASSARMSSGIEPVFRLTLSDRELRRTPRDSGPCYAGIAAQIQPNGVVAIMREALGADFKAEHFHLRSRRFALPPGKVGQDNACLGDHATLVTFRQADRGFYLWIAAGRRTPPDAISKLLRSLDTLIVSKRG